jgi:4-coumarate--CoA ligase
MIMARYDNYNKIYHGPKFPPIYNENLSIGQLVLHHLSKMPNKVIQISDDDGIELTSDQMAEMMVNISKNLSKMGMRAGDVIGIFAKKTTYVVPVIFGCFLLRTPVNPVETSFEIDQVVEIFRKTRPKIVFCDFDVIEKLITVLQILENEATIVSLTEYHTESLHISELLKSEDDISDE